MKEDILEQIVDDYLKLDGYFTVHNVRFHPSCHHPEYQSQQDSVGSDIDVVGYNPRRRGFERVLVVTCKSWQGGFATDWWASNVSGSKKIAGREAWKCFRELVRPKWTEAFLHRIEALTGQTKFTYITAVTWANGELAVWQESPPLRQAINGNPIRILTLKHMLDSVHARLTGTPATSAVGRLVQLIKASDRTGG